MSRVKSNFLFEAFDEPTGDAEPGQFESSADAGSGTAADPQFPPMMCEDDDVFCENHLDLASPAAIARKEQMQRRLAFVQSLWNDAARFEEIVTSGRYLKLCNLTEWISDYDERAWEKVKSEILAAREKLLAA